MQNDIVKQPDQKPETAAPKVDIVTTNRPAELQHPQPQNQPVQPKKPAQKDTRAQEDDEIKLQPNIPEHKNQQPQINKQNNKNSTDKPVAAITIAIIICLAMIGLVVYPQLSN